LKFVHAIAVSATVLLSACAAVRTSPVEESKTQPAPKERVFAYQEASEGTLPVSITRDGGLFGSGCFIAVEANRKLLARLDPGEVVRFHLPPGEHELTVLPDPMGKGLCSSAMQGSPVRETYKIGDGMPSKFRLSSRMYRRPELEPIE